MPGIVSSCNGQMGMRMDSAEGRGWSNHPDPNKERLLPPHGWKPGASAGEIW